MTGYTCPFCEGIQLEADELRKENHELKLKLALTPAEYETGVLVSQELSNTEIAERLFLARVTIANQLHSIYIKLGIIGAPQNKREELIRHWNRHKF